jgi:hypothetical protein
MSIRSLCTLISLLLLLLSIGEGQQSISVKSIDKCTGMIKDSIGDYTPSIGKSYLVANIEIRNNGYDGSFPVSPSYFAVTIDGNQHYNSYATYGLDAAFNLPHLSDTNLGNGNSISGYVAFEIPQGSSNKYSLNFVGKPNWNVVIESC